ncbi:hypothetical protein VKT23_016130 [Stygiomarasmius scandens]|uniref:Uncharacterized protein n=1 Tax=Marasmiellus scandens TaxID=2682957 RepID=A0ABR1J098_9AGAR
MAALTYTFGCLLVALFFVLLFYGMSIILSFQYFEQFRSDSPVFKLMILILMTIGTIQATTAFAWAYVSLINEFGSIFELDILPSTALAQLMSMASFIRS